MVASMATGLEHMVSKMFSRKKFNCNNKKQRTMKTEQFKRATEIAARIKYLAEKRDQLKAITENGIQQIEIKTYDRGSHTYFKLDDNVNHTNAIQHQPPSIAVILDALIQTSASVYQREIDDLEREFNSL
jgi:hypothetical protein